VLIVVVNERSPLINSLVGISIAGVPWGLCFTYDVLQPVADIESSFVTGSESLNLIGRKDLHRLWNYCHPLWALRGN